MGTAGSTKQFNKKFKTPLAERQKKTILSAMKFLYDRLKETKTEISHHKQQADTQALEARKKMLKVPYSPAHLATTEQTPTLQTEIAHPVAGQFPWADGNRDTNCAKAENEAGKPGMALETDMPCLCIKHENGNDDQCTTGFTPSAANYSSARTNAEAVAAWKELKTKCTNTVVTTDSGTLAD
uniref:Variant surface glycoprotein n=1 Tax=Trypanosoma brucei TaxID=5691 RepID=A0A1V0FYN2_9TRYP|nr:variant surface glycoprotein [Trypanosoma brucei]